MAARSGDDDSGGGGGWRQAKDIGGQRRGCGVGVWRLGAAPPIQTVLSARIYSGQP
jgi:hypothetical protein